MALLDPYQLNLINPAISAYSLDPVFQVSGVGSFSTFRTQSETFDNNRFMLNNIGMSLPIKRNQWGLNVGLVPLTNVGYDVNVTENGGDDIGEYQTEYSGTGGLNQFYLGTAYKIFSRMDSAANVTAVAVGVNYNFDFGVIESLRRIHFVDDLNSMGVESTEKFIVKDHNVEGGIHFQTNLLKRTQKNPRFLKLLLGFSTTLGTDLSLRRDAHAYTIKYVNPDVISTADTLMESKGADGQMYFPARYTAGFALDYFSVQRRRLRLSMDYTTQLWSEYSVSFSDHALRTAMRNSETISAGLEYTPEVGSKDFFPGIRYRLGFRYEKSNLMINNEGINDVGMSFGLTLPVNLKRSLTNSTFNIAGRYGTFGTVDNGLIEEEYFHIYVGFSFTPHFRNRWFVQPKYD